MGFKSNLQIASPAERNESDLLSFSKDVHLQMEKVVEDVITGITRNRAIFREEDVIRSVMKRAPDEFKKHIIEDDKFEALVRYYLGRRPLLQLPNDNVTTPEMAEIERMMIQHAGLEDYKHLLDPKIVNDAIARKKGISDEQIKAVEAACNSPRRVTVIEGTAGAGKSFTMEAVKEAFAESGYMIMGAALSWNAARVLGASIKLDDCMAIEKMVQGLREARLAGTDFFRKPTLLIIDEAGMVGTHHMATILEETANSSYPVKVVLTGDSLQVNPVDAGNALQAIVEYHGTTRIDTIRRQKQASHRRAVKRFSMREGGKAIYPFLHQECFHWCRDKEMVFNKVVQDFISFRHHHGENKSALVLALSNQDVLELNMRIRAIYKRLGLVEAKEVKAEVTDGRVTWEAGFSVGDEVVLRASGKEMIVYHIDPDAPVDDESTWQPKGKGVYNRNAGKIVAIRKSTNPLGSYDFVVDMGGETPGRVIVNSQKYKHPKKGRMPMIHNFATTIYGSQGQTVDKVFLLDSPMFEFRLAYVGMSRHREQVEVYLDETELHNRMDRMLNRVAPQGVKEEPTKPGEPPKPLPVPLGRYRRSEMLQMVAKNWSKQSLNLTAMMFERIKRLGLDRPNAKEELARTEIRAEDGEEELDFIPEINVRIPKVDIEAIMRLPEPIEEEDLVRPSEVEEHNKHLDSRYIPVRSQYQHSEDVVVEPKEEPGLFRKLAGIFSGEPGAPKSKKSAEYPSPRINETEKAFAYEPKDVSGVFKPKSKSLAGKLLGRHIPVEVPFVKEAPPVGSIVDGAICFDGVPQTPPPPGGTPPSVSADFLKSVHGQYWAEGRYQEPRILARDSTGAVVARYRLDGRCVVGEGYPPVLLNQESSPDTPLVIVPGAKEWFLMAEATREKYKNTPAKAPHLIWGAKDVDWGMIAKDMQGFKVIIARSRHDERQARWAASLANILETKWGIKATITPRIEDAAPQVSRSPRRSP